MIVRPDCALALAALLLGPVSATLASEEAVSRPSYSFLRSTEDWSSWRNLDPEDRQGWPDGIKFVPLNEDGSHWASFGGHARLRLEDWSNFGFGAPATNDDTFLLWRVAAHADLHFGEDLRLFVEGKGAGATDRDLPGGRRTLDVDSLALEQAFVDLTLLRDEQHSLTLRPGRQQLQFGRQRLVSPLPWANTLRRWDGVSAILQTQAWTTHAFWTQFAPVQKHEFNDSDRHTQFFGVYATGPVSDSRLKADAYLLGLDRRDAVMFNGSTGDEERYTLGGRLFGPIGDAGLEFDVEGAYQFGRIGAADIRAFMIASELAWRIPDDAWSTRIHLGFDYASGDDDPGGDVETFNQLFPLGHAYHGYIDAVGRQNAVDVSLGLTTRPWERTTLGATGHWFWRASDADALYNAGGGVVRAGGLSSSREVGIEIDLTVKHQITRDLAALAGYSHFFAGDFIEESGASDDIGFAYFQLQYTF